VRSARTIGRELSLSSIVNRSFANRYFAGKGLGKQFKANIEGETAYDFKTLTIVGISDDVRHGGIESEFVPEAFLPIDQSPQGSLSIALRTEGDPLPLADALRQAVTATDHAQPVFNLESMEERVSDATARRRLIMLLIASFAVLAVLLSAVGVYGVFAYSVNQRSQEMGIRLALGASREGLLRLIVTQAARLIATGGFLGIGSALLLSKLLKSMLVGVTSHDALSFSLAWMLMTLAALAASMIPATRAARIDLNLVLRSE
jgi:predicted lysophospholipase L1 biosynthesis ABC-type transport system permease subunit